MITQENIESKITISLEPLRLNLGNRFTVRFLDMNEQQKNLLATRIKVTARQWNLRNEQNQRSTPEKIYQALKEINPIIFSESTRAYIDYRSHRCFGIHDSHTLTSYNFEILCQSIYKMICIKRPLKQREMERIARLTSTDYTRAIDHIRRNFIPSNRSENPTETQSISIPEFGIEEIENIRRRAESNGANNIPNAMFDPDENIVEELFSPLPTGWMQEARQQSPAELYNENINRNISLGRPIRTNQATLRINDLANYARVSPDLPESYPPSELDEDELLLEQDEATS